MADPSRMQAGFRELSRGMNYGIAPSLLPANQVSYASNWTFRGAYGRTRPPFEMRPFTFADDATETNWTGKWQGAEYYDGEMGQSGWVISRGGYLFFLTSDTFVLRDITPHINVIVLADFTVPAPLGIVNVYFNAQIPEGGLFIDGGIYATNSPTSVPTPMQYFGFASNPTVLAGTPVMTGTGPLVYTYPNPAGYDYVYMFQAENYMIVMSGQHPTVIWDGTMARLSGPGEIPPGNLGAYGWGRIWVSLTDNRTFMAGNLVYGTSNNRADILNWDENDFWNEGGAFSVPYNAGPITGMQFLATPDTSLGTGPLLVGTPNMVFTVNAPVDRTIWKNLRYPIQTISLLQTGPLAPRGLVSINNDVWFRSTAGYNSFITARRNFGSTWANTPMSREVQPILDYDDHALLYYGSGILFDNRYLSTVSPNRQAEVMDVQHRGLVSNNFDLVSDQGSKTAPAWEGIWDCELFQIFQLNKCRINGEERGWIFANGCSGIELWEIKKSGTHDTYSNVTEGVTTITRGRIRSRVETRSEGYGSIDLLKWLRMAVLGIDEVADEVTIAISFKSDQYPDWIPWQTRKVCATVTQCALPAVPDAGACTVWRPNARLYQSSVEIGQPREQCNIIINRPVSWGFEFQFRFEILGHCRFKRFMTYVNAQTDATEGNCDECETVNAI